MRLQLLILLPLFVSLHGSELTRCCSGGARHYRQKSVCTDIRTEGSGVSCSRAASICCLRALLDQSCDDGTSMAEREDYCLSNINQIGGGIRKECCDCCLLAKDLNRHNEECVAPTGFSAACLRSFNKCCKRKVDISYPSLITSSPGSVDVLGVNNRCPTAKCEHLCNDRGGDTVECSCRPGYDLGADGYSCIDIDECLLLVDDCLESQRCLNTPGSFKCIRTLSCGTGYALDSVTEQCIDVDECNMGSHDCGPQYQCRNTQGSYRCDPKKCADGEKMNPRTGECTRIECAIGYKPVNGRCEDINECETPGRCRQFEECINTQGSYRCQEKGDLCSKGLRIDKNSGICVDIDECADGTHLCEDNQCINIHGSYKCRCPAGFDFSETTKRCEDVDECVKFAGHVCSQHATCENTYGSFKCHCNPGYRIAEDARKCDDIDECSLGLARCAQRCVNIPGSYQCICERGYQLGADGVTCEDIDECALWAGSGDDLCMGECINVPGSYRCQCPPGYEIQEDGRTCKDIDECAKGECQGAERICVNTLGSFKCLKIECPPNYVHDKNYKNRCNRARRLCESAAACKNMPMHISWQYIAIPRFVPISSHRTSITLFTIKGPSTASSTVQFELNVKRSVPEVSSVVPAVRSNFLLQKGEERNSAVIALRDSLDGPQEIELELILRLTIDGVFQGKFIANLIVYVAAHTRQRNSSFSMH